MDEKSQLEIEWEHKIGLHRNIYLTHFIYPLSTPITISRKFGIVLDNPRSKDEIEFIKSKIASAIKNRTFDSFRSNKKFELTDLASKIVQGFPKEKQSYFTGIKSNDAELVDMLTNSWCIVRHDNQPKDYYWFRSPKKLDEYQKKAGARQLVQDICCSLSFLLKFDVGNSFLLDENVDEQKSIDEIRTSILGNSENRESFIHQRFGKIEKQFTKLSGLLDSSLFEDKVLYVGSVLRTMKYVRDYRIEILSLVSLLELFVAHNPDSQRFNVEDSIGKQFRTKVSILARDLSPSLDELENELKKIYKIRSKIAHGDFIELKKELSKNSNHLDLEEAMSEIVLRLYDIVREVFFSSLQDPELAMFLKNS